MRLDYIRAEEIRDRVEQTVISTYRNSCKNLHYQPKDALSRRTKRWAEKYMLSEEFKMFSALNGRKLLELLEEENEELYGKR